MFKTLGTIFLLTSLISSPIYSKNDIKTDIHKNVINSGSYESCYIDSDYLKQESKNFFVDYIPSGLETLTFMYSGDFYNYDNTHYDYMMYQYYNVNNSNRSVITLLNSLSDRTFYYESNLNYGENAYKLVLRYRGKVISLTEEEADDIYGYPHHQGYFTNFRQLNFNVVKSIFNEGSIYFDTNAMNFNYNYLYNYEKPHTYIDSGSTYSYTWYENYVIHDESEFYSTNQIIERSFDVPVFTLNGGYYAYNRITLRYKANDGMQYPKSIYVNPSNDITYDVGVVGIHDLYFYEMVYQYNYFDGQSQNDIKTETLACSRGYQSFGDYGSVIGGFVIFNNTEWNNEGVSDFNDVAANRLVFFTSDKNSILNILTNIGLIDSANYGGGNIVINDGNTFALESAFSLLNMAFSGIVSLFGWSILPSITLGALLLIPFAVAIILFVIKLFKR